MPVKSCSGWRQTPRVYGKADSLSSQIYDSFKRIRKNCFRGIAEALILS